MLQLSSVPAINRIFYLFKRSKAFDSANMTNILRSIIVSLKIPNRYLQNVELENCWTNNYLKFCLLICFKVLKLLKVPH